MRYGMKLWNYDKRAGNRRFFLRDPAHRRTIHYLFANGVVWMKSITWARPRKKPAQPKQRDIRGEVALLLREDSAAAAVVHAVVAHMRRAGFIFEGLPCV